MSQFQGFMGGDVGQGYNSEDANKQGVNYSNQQDFQGSLPPPQTPTTQPRVAQTPSSGSITQFFHPNQQVQQQPTSMYASPQTIGQSPHLAAYPQQGMQQQRMMPPQMQSQMQPQSQHFQQHSSTYAQQPGHIQNNQVPQTHPQQQQQGTGYQHNNARQLPPPQHQPAANLHTQQHGQPATNLQPQQQGQPVTYLQPQQQGLGGSYSARSAQAHATPCPTKQMTPTSGQSSVANQVPTKATKHDDSPAVLAQQNRILTDCTRKVQEHAYYMKQAMDKDELSAVLDRASNMVGELGDTSSGMLTPKNYYELHMRALDDMPNLEEYFLSLTGAENAVYSMKDLYGYVQYCPRVLPRLYLQISAGSALIRSREETAKSVLSDLIEAVKCVQNPLRGLFLRHFLLQVTRDKLPDGDQVQDAYEFVLANFIEMNRLWVRIQHLPGDGKSKEQRKRRERERNELRILVGTNLVRLSQLEAVTSKIYGEVILPKILEQITACGDPLAQAYLIDCIIQVFPDEYHIETLSILLAVCPKLRDKVNIRTIMQSLMDRLANYYAEEELLDEADTNDVKKSIFRDSFPMFEDCVQKVFQARGPKLVSREVIRLQTALLNFSLKCYKGNMEQVSRCLGVCIEYIRQAVNATAIANQTPLLEDSAIRLDQASVAELEKMLSIPLDSLALKVLELNHYADLLQFLPWENRRDVGMTMLRAIDTSGVAPTTVKELEELFSIILPVIRGQETTHSPMAHRFHEDQEESTLVSKLVHLLDHENPDVTYEMLSVARSHLSEAGAMKIGVSLVPVVFSALRLANKINDVRKGAKVLGDVSVKETHDENSVAKPSGASLDETVQLDHSEAGSPDETAQLDPCEEGEQLDSGEMTEDVEGRDDKARDSSMAQLHGDNAKQTSAKEDEANEEGEHQVFLLSCRKVFLFVQTTISLLSKGNPELGVKLYLHTALAADGTCCSEEDSGPDDSSQQIVGELFAQAFQLHEEEIDDTVAQQRCIVNMIGALLACQSLQSGDYEAFITKVAQYAAKLIKKQNQCQMVALCSHLFYAADHVDTGGYQNPQRTLECLQRALKLADASVTSAPSNIYLFIDLMEHYLYFYEENNPVITAAYVTGLVALIKEHLDTLSTVSGTDGAAVGEARSHFEQVIEYIRRKKREDETAGRFLQIDLGD